MLYMHHHETSGHPVIDIAPAFWSTLAVLWVLLAAVLIYIQANPG